MYNIESSVSSDDDRSFETAFVFVALRTRSLILAVFLSLSAPLSSAFFLLAGFAVMFHFSSADPTADVEGLDVQAKIALLTKLAFGATVSSNSVRRKKYKIYKKDGSTEILRVAIVTSTMLLYSLGSSCIYFVFPYDVSKVQFIASVLSLSRGYNTKKNRAINTKNHHVFRALFCSRTPQHSPCTFFYAFTSSTILFADAGAVPGHLQLDEGGFRVRQDDALHHQAARDGHAVARWQQAVRVRVPRHGAPPSPHCFC